MYNRIPENLITPGNSIHAVNKGFNDFSLKMASDNTETVNDVRSHTHTAIGIYTVVSFYTKEI
jgi:hypothetical protein